MFAFRNVSHILHPEISRILQYRSTRYVVMFYLLNLTQTMDLDAPLGSTVAFTASIYLPTSSTITGMRGAAGRRQPATAKPPCTTPCIPVTTTDDMLESLHMLVPGTMPNQCWLHILRSQLKQIFGNSTYVLGTEYRSNKKKTFSMQG